MDQIPLILSATDVGIVITSIQAIEGGLGLILAIGAVWGLFTKNINKKIKGKADSSQVNSMFELRDERINGMEKEVRENKKDYKRLLDMQLDTNTKVTQIWQFLADKK